MVGETRADRLVRLDDTDPEPPQVGLAADPAPEQERRRPVCARGDDDRVGVDPPAVGGDAGRTSLLDEDVVDERVGEDG
jgi:hypothetical protein